MSLFQYWVKRKMRALEILRRPEGKIQSLAGCWAVVGMGLAFGSLGCVTEQVMRNGDGPQDKKPVGEWTWLSLRHLVEYPL